MAGGDDASFKEAPAPPQLGKQQLPLATCGLQEL